jgi:hypothetical protein
MRSRFVVAVVVMVAACGAHADEYRAALVRPGLPGIPEGLVDGLASELTDAGYVVEDFSLGDLCDPARLSAADVDLLVLPDAASLPADSIGPIEAYLKAGGDIIALNAPLWERPLYEDEGQWLDREQFRKKHGGELIQSVLFDFPDGSLEGWTRATDDPMNVTQHGLVPGAPAPAKNALRVHMMDMTGWETYACPDQDKPFPDGHTLTVFHAKGGPRTTSLSIEWVERDGSRWIGVVPLEPEWREYVLEPEDFKFWKSVPARWKTVFNPANAIKVAVGLSNTHTACGGGEHEFWLGAFGTAQRTPIHEKLLSSIKKPLMDALSPEYKFFPCRDVAYLSVWYDGAIDGDPTDDLNEFFEPLPVPNVIRSPHPRPTAAGFDKGRAWRWLPLMVAKTADGEWRGDPAALLIHADGPWKGGVWASFGVPDLTWYMTPKVMGVIGDVAKSMGRGLFLVDGGTECYTYFENQEVTVGMNVVNLSKDTKTGISGSMGFCPLGISDQQHKAEWTFDLAPGEQKRLSETLRMKPKDWSKNGFWVATELAHDGAPIDNAIQEAHLWKPQRKRSYVTVENGDFMLDGERWRPHGVNYMPSSGIGTEDGDYFEHWMGARAYDPEIFQRDIQHCKDMGLNAVSIFLYRESMESQNLLDMLRRIDAMDMKVNLSLRPGTPVDFRWDEIREMIEYYRLWEHDCIFAYDLAWEPMWGNQDKRKRWDGRWHDWIVERYGSVENAEKDWGYAVPRDAEGKVTNPDTKLTVEDGEWRRMVAAYRRFLDTLLYEYYSRARTLVRTVDDRHLVSFRMTEAADPTFKWIEQLPYDFPYLAAAVDILEPEAYGRIGDWEKVKPGWFQFEYARWAAPELPMMWGEAGVSAWAEGKMNAPPELLAYQGDYYKDLYRMFIGSAADGIFFWWFPGGYRVGENSDYGIIEPDGSDRAVSKVIRDHADAFINGPDAKPVDHWLTIDRDAHPAGAAGIYDAVGEEFWEAIDAGKTPGLKTEGTGTNSATCPLVAVGGTPCTGSNPPKYLDGFFDLVEVKDRNGEWAAVEPGGSVKVAPGKPVVARVKVTNLAEAEWLPGKKRAGKGGVSIVADGSGDASTPLPKAVGCHDSVEIRKVTVAEKAPEAATEVTLTFVAERSEMVGEGPTLQRVPFGPRYRFTVDAVK